MRHPGGYATLTSPDAVKEADTFTCGHCQHIVHVKPLAAPEDAGGLCKTCMRLICGPCVDKLVCAPWEKRFEEMEARERFLRSAGI